MYLFKISFFFCIKRTRDDGTRLGDKLAANANYQTSNSNIGLPLTLRIVTQRLIPPSRLPACLRPLSLPAPTAARFSHRDRGRGNYHYARFKGQEWCVGVSTRVRTRGRSTRGARFFRSRASA